MDFAKALSWFESEWKVIASAPLTFTVALLLASFIIWKIVQLEFANRLADAVSRLETAQDVVALLQARIDDYANKLKGATPEQAKEKIDILSDELRQLTNYLKLQSVATVNSAENLSVANIKKMSNSDIRNRVVKLAQEMRRIEDNNNIMRRTFDKPATNDSDWDKQSWDKQSRELVKLSLDRKLEWQTGLMPDVSAIWKEMKLRIYGSRPAPHSHKLDMVANVGMLAGAAPLHEAAMELENLARELPD